MSSDELCEAAACGDVVSLVKLLATGININRPSSRGLCPLNAAIAGDTNDSDSSDSSQSQGYCESESERDGEDDKVMIIVRLLLEAGASVKQADSFRLDECLRRPVHYAAACDRLDVLQLLEQYGADLDLPDAGNSTPLHHAAANGNIDVVRYLLKRGCALQQRSNSGRTALWKAATGRHSDVTRLLLDAGSDVNARSQVGCTVLTDVLRQNDIIIAQMLLEYGADVTLKDVEGNRPVHWVAGDDAVEALMLLLSRGIDVNCCNDHGNTPLHCAARNNCISSTAHLLNHSNVDINVKNRYGQSALYTAMLSHCEQVADILMACGATLAACEIDRLEAVIDKRCSEDKFSSPSTKTLLNIYTAVKSLTFLCRISIRNSARKPVADSVKLLSLPTCFVKFILLHDCVCL